MPWTLAALPAIALLIDSLLTLLAQQAAYWVHHTRPNETFILAYYSLEAGPVVFAVLALLSAAVMLTGARFLPLWFSAPVAAFFVVAHTAAAAGHVFSLMVLSGASTAVAHAAQHAFMASAIIPAVILVRREWHHEGTASDGVLKQRGFVFATASAAVLSLLLLALSFTPETNTLPALIEAIQTHGHPSSEKRLCERLEAKLKADPESSSRRGTDWKGVVRFSAHSARRSHRLAR